MTDGEVAAFRQAFREAATGPPRLLTPLPRRLRLRLWVHGHVDDVAYWLVCHGHCTAARRLFRMW